MKMETSGLSYTMQPNSTDGVALMVCAHYICMYVLQRPLQQLVCSLWGPPGGACFPSLEQGQCPCHLIWTTPPGASQMLQCLGLPLPPPSVILHTCKASRVMNPLTGLGPAAHNTCSHLVGMRLLAGSLVTGVRQKSQLREKVTGEKGAATELGQWEHSSYDFQLTNMY